MRSYPDIRGLSRRAGLTSDDLTAASVLCTDGWSQQLAYEQQETVKELAQRFAIHRLTVTALLRRQGVELRRAGLALEEVPAAADLYRHAGR